MFSLVRDCDNPCTVGRAGSLSRIVEVNLVSYDPAHIAPPGSHLGLTGCRARYCRILEGMGGGKQWQDYGSPDVLRSTLLAVCFKAKSQQY